MDAFNPGKLIINYCPRLGTRKCCWDIKDLGYLGLGTALYLNFMRWMAGTFFVVGLLSVHNAYYNSQGDRYTQNTLGPIEYGATHSSIGNLGGENWTVGGDNYCSGHGFAAEVCLQGGWGDSGSAWEYPCGDAPDAAGSVQRSLSRFIFGGVEITCTKREVQCSCMPGWAGARCDQPISGGLPVLGWCAPPTHWWESNDADVRSAGATDDGTRDAQICNGRGFCAARVFEADQNSLRYTFCQCDRGSYGDQCQYVDTTNDRYGDFYNYAFTAKDKNLCNKGAIPAIVREFFQVTFPRAECKDHGFGLTMPLTNTGKLDKSNAFRVQTRGVCYCEPGYNGEECLGGEPVPDGQGWVHGACSAVLLIVLATLYRDRKRVQKTFDTEVVTASDYTVFVNHLPSVPLDRIREVQAHFEQFGPVHFVSPAPGDDKLMALQKAKNFAMTQLLVKQEKDAYARKLEAWKRDLAAAESADDEAAIAELQQAKPEPILIAKLATGTGHEDTNWVSDLKPWQLFLAKLPILNTMLLSRSFFHKYLMHLNNQIKRELEQKHSNVFARAYVTFKTMQGRDNCLTLYSERRDGMFGKLPDYDPRILYQGKHWIDVSTAPEPEEVQWQSLAVGPRVRGLLVTLSVIVMIGIIAGMFNLVLVINSSKGTGIIGLLISLAVLALNIIVGNIWVASAGVEKHYYTGAAMRSVFLKILITQIFITLLAGTIGVYGYPIDAKNGYVQDWYKEAGGFVFRMVLIESIVPPLMDAVAAPYRLNLFNARKETSATKKAMLLQPPVSILAARCASLMRTVIMCCAFNAGLPVLNFAVAAGLAIRYFTDKHCYEKLFAVVKSGPELARALELSLMFAAAVQIVMGWVTLRAGWQNNVITEIIFYIGVIGALWAVLGYFSYRWYRGRDCWCGTGPIIPCVGWLCCFSERYLWPFHAIHKAFMVVIFGVEFFGGVKKRADLGGSPYEEAMRAQGLRRIPYYLYERGQLHPDLISEEKLPRRMNGPATLAQIESDKIARKDGADQIQLTVSPLLELHREKKLKEIAANKATSMGIGGPSPVVVVGAPPPPPPPGAPTLRSVGSKAALVGARK